MEKTGIAEEFELEVRDVSGQEAVSVANARVANTARQLMQKVLNKMRVRQDSSGAAATHLERLVAAGGEAIRKAVGDSDSRAFLRSARQADGE